LQRLSVCSSRSSTFARSLVVVAVLLCVAYVASAQVPANMPTGPSGANIQVTTQLVVLDVVVTDAKGNVVSGLKKDAFTVMQDGVPQKIRNFESWTERPAAPSVTAFDRFGHPDWGDTPLTIFVLDELNTPFDEKSYAAFTLKKYLEAQPTLLKSPSCLLFVNDGGLHSLVDYTRDRKALIQAIDARPRGVADQLARGANLELLAESFAVLRQIALSAEGSHAHKNLVWLGRGFPALDPTQLNDPANAALEAGIRDVVSLLVSARITVYKIDPITADALSPPTDLNTAIALGIPLNNANIDPPVEDPLAENFSFNSFAVATGGAYFYGRNDLDRLISDSLDRGDKFYTLSFTPAKRMEGFRPLRVVMKDPALHATTRTGYYTAATAPEGERAQTSLPVDLKLAAISLMSYQGVSVRIPDVKVSSSNMLTVEFGIEDRTLTWSTPDAGRPSAKITALLVALDVDRKVQRSAAATLSLAVVDSTAIAKGIVTTSSTILVDKRTRYVRLLIEDASGRIGSADVDAEELRQMVSASK
jgi:VWFA-related protein